jgi:hypothetical protein
MALSNQGLRLDNFWAHVTLPTYACQEDEQLFKAVTWDKIEDPLKESVIVYGDIACHGK